MYAVTYRWLDYELNLKQVEMLERRYSVKEWTDRCIKASMGSELQYDRLIAWLELYR